MEGSRYTYYSYYKYCNVANDSYNFSGWSSAVKFEYKGN